MSLPPGTTLLGLDFANHLWIVLSTTTASGEIAIANLTTHGRSPRCGDHCVVVRAGEHSYVAHDSCLYYRGALLNPAQPLLDAEERGLLQTHDECSAELLLRIQEGALESPFTMRAVKAAIRATLGK